MPFGPLTTPALGLGLLKASLAESGLRIRTLYFTLRFADRIGPALYSRISEGHPAFPALVGEWIFSAALFGDAAEADVDGYCRDVLRGGLPEHALREPVAPEFVDEVRRIRATAADFVAECCDAVVAQRPRLVCLTSVFQQQVASLALARRIRESLPDTSILLGGANCEGPMGAEVVRRFPFVDAVVSGEGDLVFPALVRELFAGRPIDGIPGVNTRVTVAAGQGVRQAPVVRDLDALPFPDHDDFFAQWGGFAERHPGLEPVLLYETSRGCWWGAKHHCTFCGLNGGTMAFRSKSADRALAELRHLTGRYPARGVAVVDNILDMKYFHDFVPALAELDLGLELFYEVKANLRKEQLRLLKAAGINSICPGVESLDTPTLALMRKGVTALQNVQLLKWCRQVGVQALWNLLWGFPGEDRETYARTAALIPLLAHLRPPVWFLPIRMDRFSPYFEEPEAFGVSGLRPYPAYRYVYPTLTPDAAAGLAYYFTADRETCPPADERIAAVGAAIDRWRVAHGSSALAAVDDGTRLTVIDTRPGIGPPVTELEGVDRLLLTACDAIRSERQLLRDARDEPGQALAPRDLRHRLQTLVDRGLMLEEDGRFLSLPVATESFDPAPAVLERLLASLASVGAAPAGAAAAPVGAAELDA